MYVGLPGLVLLGQLGTLSSHQMTQKSCQVNHCPEVSAKLIRHNSGKKGQIIQAIKEDSLSERQEVYS